jgi:hypothetical protein
MAMSQLINGNECAAEVETRNRYTEGEERGISRHDKQVWRWRQKELSKLKTRDRQTEGDEVSGRSGS